MLRGGWERLRMRGTATGGLEACGGERTECLGFQSPASQRPSPGVYLRI